MAKRYKTTSINALEMLTATENPTPQREAEDSVSVASKSEAPAAHHRAGSFGPPDQLPANYMQRFAKEGKLEDRYVKQTYWIDKTLLQRLNAVCEGKHKGYKTGLVNEAIRQMLEKIAKEEKGAT